MQTNSELDFDYNSRKSKNENEKLIISKISSSQKSQRKDMANLKSPRPPPQTNMKEMVHIIKESMLEAPLAKTDDKHNTTAMYHYNHIDWLAMTY